MACIDRQCTGHRLPLSIQAAKACEHLHKSCQFVQCLFTNSTSEQSYTVSQPPTYSSPYVLPANLLTSHLAVYINSPSTIKRKLIIRLTDPQNLTTMAR